MLLDYETKHDCREKGFEGPNLSKKRRMDILAQTPEVDAESIHDLGSDRFSMQSGTHSLQMYSVKLGTQSYDCPDWPRVRLCKHVTTVAHFFRNGDRPIVVVVDMVPKTVQLIWEGSAGGQSNGSATSILENVIAISQVFLGDGAPLSPGTI